jgi:tetratricopeptide (TPR) repeat protein
MIPVGLLALATVTLAAADEVVLVPGATVKQAVGGRVRGSVQSESATEVVVRLGANTITVPADQVASIHYTDGAPPSMTLAESNETGGQLAKAVELYKKSAGEATKPLVKQAAEYKVAEVTADLAMADPGKASEAVALLEGFLRNYPTSRQGASAWESLARIQLQRGDFAQADKAIAALAKLPAGADRAAVLRAKVFARKGDHAAAVAELDRQIKAAPAGSVRGREARLARAESLAALKKFAEAEAEVHDVIKAMPAEDAAQSAAYNTLGDCLRAAGRPKDALFAYLHTDLLFDKDKEQHPRALARIAQLWRELKRDDRADEVMQRLRQAYPQSPWLSASSTTP